MKKMALSLTAFSIITAGLAGCGDVDNQAGDPGRNAGNQVGQQQQDAGQAGWDRTDRGDRGEGPITDMFTVDDRGDGQQNQNPRTNQGQGGAGNQNMDDMFTGQNQNQTGNGWGGDDGEQQDIEQTVSDMDNVESTHVVVDDDNVLVGVRTTGDDGDETTDDIREELEDETDKEVYVTDDPDMFDEIGGAADDLAEGTGQAVDEAGSTIDGIIEDLSDAAQRPFEQSR
ncbi:YhcN/YlaJ family sporulation lipoprotein [Natribacillus halophilus]|uniref:Sporulation lipoprotein YhcN/YlaJ (Spore_YhcN_YlaJ) n=1 Tax=Natribacillus halophilus TaxID=549003 RepID=A0A1G8NXP1_9BACI|nr:YhcN/YlaJ family sporulation lipoprotein [Natribacillus halophilus]SDI85017.1 Sporulation lipoprotein YhcN/YlaJ (Spore_YhcN_YlaJ) [Natribacillus halophilus]